MPRALSIALLALSSLLFACGPVKRSDGGSGLLAPGDAAPSLSADDHAGKHVELASLGAPSLVYFYPKDNTPGCTKEACALRDAWQRYLDAGVVVIGVSADTPESHREFAEEHGLPFSLVSDTSHAWSKAFGVKTMAGMARRQSFLMDANGKVVKVYADVDPGVHADEVLKDAKALGLTAD